MTTSSVSSSTTSAATAATTPATTTAASTSSTNTNSANSLTATNQAAAQKLITALGAGSGVDVNALAQNLVDAERIPQENAINAKITTNQSRISGYSAVSYVLSQVQTALNDLKDQNSFNTLTVNSTSSAFSITASTSAAVGSHDLDVLSLAKAQRTVSGSFSTPTQSLNGGKAMTYTLTTGSGSSAVSTDISLADGQDTPRALADAINAANKGVAAQVVNTGDATNPYKLVLIGQTGAANGFTLTPKYSMGGVNGGDVLMSSQATINLKVTKADSTSTELGNITNTPNGVIAALNGANLGLSAQLVSNASGATYPNKIFVSGADGVTIQTNSTSTSGYDTTLVAPTGLSFTNNQTASDAQIQLDGVSYTRNSNSFNDVLSGVTFNLNAVTTTTNASGAAVDNTAQFSLTRDTSTVKTRLDAVVSAYNDAMTIFNAVSDPKSTLATYGATLVGDSTVRSLSQQLHDMLVNTSSTPGTSVGALWQVGLDIDASGVMSLDSTKLDTALSNNYDDVVKTLTGDQNNLTSFSTTAGGVAGDAVRKLTQILSSSGVIATQTSNAETQNTKYQNDLSALQTRMDALLTRYQKQFAAMNTLVGSVNSQKTSLKSSFDGMMAIYTNK